LRSSALASGALGSAFLDSVRPMLSVGFKPNVNFRLASKALMRASSKECHWVSASSDEDGRPVAASLKGCVIWLTRARGAVVQQRDHGDALKGL
jgi:hypothetical protein